MDAIENHGEETLKNLAKVSQTQARRFRLSNEEVSDIQQEVMLRYFSQVRKGNEVKNPAAWVSRTSQNIGLDLYRKRKTAHLKINDPANVPEITEHTKSSNKEEITISYKGTKKEICLNSLGSLVPFVIQSAQNHKGKQVAHMWFLQECTAAEISEKTGLPLGTIRSHVSRFRQKIIDAILLSDPS